MANLMDKVQALMKSRGMTWDELAMLTHIPANRLADLSSGRQGGLKLWECQSIARALDSLLTNLFEDGFPAYSRDEHLAVEMCNRIGIQLGPIECLRRLTSPHFKKGGASCSCGRSSASA